jgi:hypothetical protein
MRLQLDSIDIWDVRPSSTTRAEEHVLYVDLEELEGLILKDKRLAAVDIDMVYPGDRVRVLNLVDVVQPRCKLDKLDADFPGFVGNIQIAGSGRTRSLRGVAVLVANPQTTRKYSAFLDMSGQGAEMSSYSRVRHVVIAPARAEGIEERDFEDAVKIAGFKTALYLARGAEGHPVDETEVFDLDIPAQLAGSDLPRVAYYYQLYSPQHDHNGISDACYYGTDLRNFTPTVIHPNEVLDGGIVGAHTIRSLDTYTIQNHALIKELYKRNGKDLTFAGIVAGVVVLDPAAKTRQSCMAASLAKNVLGADGIILSKVHGGMPHVDLGMVADECEKLGVKTAIHAHPLVSTGTLTDNLLFNSEALNLVVTVGGVLERAKIPLDADRFLGGTAETHIYCPDPIVQRAGDPVLDFEEFLLAGVHDHLGGSKIIVKDF